VDNAASPEGFDQAAREAVRAFPIDPVDLTPVWMSENVTFRVTDARDGAAYALRLHRPGYHDLPALESERLWTGALAAAGIGAPQGMRTRDGGWYAPVAIPTRGEARYAGLTRWTEGEILSEVLAREAPDAALDRLRALGALAARLHGQAAGWAPPPGFRRHALDADGLMGEAPWWGRFWESPVLSPGEQRLLAATRDRIGAVLRGLGFEPEIFGLIHADMHTNNVLVVPASRAGESLAVIDFDDAAFGWHAYDIAVALSNDWMSPRLPALQAAFLAGYREVRDLAASTEALIPMFLLARGLSLIGWLAQRPELDPAPFMTQRKAWILAACDAFEPPC
jgi:Ser/Thr protein kinase RdoA (MazF antagonist)